MTLNLMVLIVNHPRHFFINKIKSYQNRRRRYKLEEILVKNKSNVTEASRTYTEDSDNELLAFVKVLFDLDGQLVKLISS